MILSVWITVWIYSLGTRHHREVFVLSLWLLQHNKTIIWAWTCVPQQTAALPLWGLNPTADRISASHRCLRDFIEAASLLCSLWWKVRKRETSAEKSWSRWSWSAIFVHFSLHTHSVPGWCYCTWRQGRGADTKMQTLPRTPPRSAQCPTSH